MNALQQCSKRGCLLFFATCVVQETYDAGGKRTAQTNEKTENHLQPTRPYQKPLCTTLGSLNKPIGGNLPLAEAFTTLTVTKTPTFEQTEKFLTSYQAARVAMIEAKLLNDDDASMTM